MATPASPPPRSTSCASRSGSARRRGRRASCSSASSWPVAWARRGTSSAGSRRRPGRPDAVIVDELYRDKLGVTRLGQRRDPRAPRACRRLHARHPHLHHGAAGVHVVQARAGLRRPRRGPDPLPAGEGRAGRRPADALAARSTHGCPTSTCSAADVVAQQQQRYWMFGTGAGITVLIAAAPRPAGRRGRRRADDLRRHGRPPPRVRHAQGDGRDQRLHLPRHHSSRRLISAVVGYAVGIAVALVVVARQRCRAPPRSAPERRWPSACFVLDAGDVRRRVDGVDPQGDAHRSGDGLQGVTAMTTGSRHRRSRRHQDLRRRATRRCTRCAASTSTSRRARCC